MVVFLRGVNVGGHKAFQPSVLARELADFGVVNVGAAGTFVSRKPVGQRVLRAELLRRLPFKAELMICRGRDLIDLACGEPFPDEPGHKDVRRFLSVLAKRPRTRSFVSRTIFVAYIAPCANHTTPRHLSMYPGDDFDASAPTQLRRDDSNEEQPVTTLRADHADLLQSAMIAVAA